MADNVNVTQGKTEFDADTNPVIPARTTQLTAGGNSGKHVAHVKLDIGTAASEDVVDGGAVPVSGSITANAGTNLNTSALALESGGNLAAAVTALQIMDDWDESDRCKSTIIHGTPSNSGGWTDNYYASLTSTGTTSLSSARKIGGWIVGNGSATNMAFVKIYDKATAATNSDTPVVKIALGPGAAANVELEYGIPVSNGISIRATTAVADSSTASPTANDVFCTILYA